MKRPDPTERTEPRPTIVDSISRRRARSTTLAAALTLTLALGVHAQPAPETVTLDQLLDWAHEHAPDVRRARAEVLEGEAAVEAEAAWQLANPELEGAVGGRTLAGETFFEAEVGLSQRFEVSGEQALRREAAERVRERLDGEVEAARWRAHGRVHAELFATLLARERVAAAERELAFAEDVLVIAERRVAAGDEAPLMLSLAEAELARARGHLVTEQRDERLARSRLAQVAGWPGELPPLAGDLPEVRPARDLPTLIALGAEHQPALRVSDLALAEADARIRVADAEAAVEPAFGVAYGVEGGDDAVHIWLLTASVPLPFWARNQGDRARARAERGLALVEAETDYAAWEAQLARAAESVDAAAEAVAIYAADVVPAAEGHLRAIRRAFELGEIGIHEVSQTRERLLEVQETALDVMGVYLAALAELEALLGVEVELALEEVR